MSAIFGMYHTDDRPVNATDLHRMRNTLAHRGPDGSAFWQEHTIGLGHCMFHTTQESLLEQLPLVDTAAKLAITADARIDNREELINTLHLTADCHEAISDSQLILASYAHWGVECVRHLIGDFAFAIWDGVAQHIFLARDVFGLKPLYYAHDDWGIAFATEIKALLCLPETPNTLNEERIADYLLLQFNDTHSTFYQGILRVPPAHTLLVTREKTELREYWRPDPVTELRLKSDAEYDEAFLTVFRDAVECRLRSAFPVGSALSGGMDSSSITCLARDLLVAKGQPPLHTFSDIFDSLPACDERHYIQTVIDQGQIRPHLVHADRLGPFTCYLTEQPINEEPMLGMTSYLHHALYGAAHEQGVRVFLDGHGGDSNISHGYEYLPELFLQGHWATLLRESHALATLNNSSLKRILLRFVLQPAMPSWAAILWHRLHGQTEAARAIGDALIAPSLLEHTQALARCVAETTNNGPAKSARAVHAAGLLYGFSPMTFEVFDKLSMHYQIEARYPFFDRRLVEFCVALPPQHKLSRGWTRAILHRTMTGILPPTIQWRVDKSNLSPAFSQGILRYDRALFSQVFHESRMLLAPFVNVGALETRLAQFLSGTDDINRHWRSVWAPMTLGAWLISRQRSAIDAKELVIP